MMNFPFDWGFDAGDEGSWTRSEFLKNYDRIFTPKPTVLRQKNPKFNVDGGTYGLEDNSDASYLMFKKVRGVYKFISYAVEP